MNNWRKRHKTFDFTNKKPNLCVRPKLPFSKKISTISAPRLHKLRKNLQTSRQHSIPHSKPQYNWLKNTNKKIYNHTYKHIWILFTRTLRRETLWRPLVCLNLQTVDRKADWKSMHHQPMQKGSSGHNLRLNLNPHSI